MLKLHNISISYPLASDDLTSKPIISQFAKCYITPLLITYLKMKVLITVEKCYIARNLVPLFISAGYIVDAPSLQKWIYLTTNK